MNFTKVLTKPLTKRLALAVVAAATLAACSKSASPPTAFGVNITIDAKASALTALLPKIHSASLVVGGAETVTKPVADSVAALQKDHEARFRFLPADTVKPNDKLDLTFEVFDTGGALLAGGTASVTLAATAVNVTIKLTGGAPIGGNDGGGNDDATLPGDGGAKLGDPCAAGGECGSGVCADGVCCNVACDGVCESCKLAASKGTCTAIPTDTDPDLECMEKTPTAAPEPDAGATSADGSDAAAGPATDASTEAGAAEAGAESDAAVINTPPGGFMTTKGACGGACNGARACKYPGATKSCGTPFCNTRREVGSFVCDGAGSCSTALSGCSSYTCDDTKGACLATCSAHSDCQVGYYCNAINQCVQKKAISVACATDPECKTDHCAGGVCCNTACDTAPLSCTASGSVGQCKCAECTTGPCQIFYPDSDGDTFGDRTATYAAHTAKAGCMNVPPTGFVADNTDCDDKDPMAHPGQTAFFGTPSLGVHTYDYDCDGKMTKFTPEYPGGSCKYCGGAGSCDATSTTCSSAGQTGSFQCPQENAVYRALSEPVSFTPPEDVSVTRASLATATVPPATVPAATVSPPPTAVICLPCLKLCCGCYANDKTGFLGTVACGATASVYTCGACAAVGGASPLSSVARQQTCR